MNKSITMKQALLSIVVVFSVMLGKAQNSISLKFKYYAQCSEAEKNTLAKLVVKCDGIVIGESSAKKQTSPNTLDLAIAKGKHSIIAALCVLQNNKWVERTTANNFAFDGLYKKTKDWKTDEQIDLVFELQKKYVVINGIAPISTKPDVNYGGFDDIKKQLDALSIELDSALSNIKNQPKYENSNSKVKASYQQELDQVNNFLKTFDNGYYGYLEVIDGYLYDRFKNGSNYTKVKISDLGKAYEQELNRKVELPCSSGQSCVWSTFTNQYHTSLSFSQSSNFNTTELILLLNNLVSSYKKSYNQNNNARSAKTNGTRPATQSSYKNELDALNNYLKTFDNGYYGYIEVVNDYIYMRFKAGKYNRFKMQDMEGAVIQAEYNRVIFKCKGSASCIETDWKENGHEPYTQFTCGKAYDYQVLYQLLNNFRDAYLGKR